MGKKFFRTAVLGMLLIFIFCMPVLAGTDIKANLNGDSLTFKNAFYVEGITMVTVDDLVELMGASVEPISTTQVKIVENNLSLLLTTGEKEATFGTSKVTLPQEPVIIQGNQIHIPLRYTADLFGFKVKWDSKGKSISLERNETRDGLTASEILVKSNNATQGVNTYSMDGTMDIDVEASSDEKADQNAPVSMTSKISGQIQNQPMQIYMKQNLTATGDAAQQIPETVVETYMTEEKMYIKTGDAEWMVLDGPFSPEFWKQQEEVQNDPLKAAAQMQELGGCFNFGNDITLDGKQYYVINASLDLSKAIGKYQELLQQAMQGVVGNDTEDLQQQIKDILANSKLDYRYSVLINKKTLISDIIKFDAAFDFTMDVPADGVTQEGQQPQTVSIYEKMVGEFRVFDFDKPFVAPDVSNAQKLELPQQTTQE